MTEGNKYIYKQNNYYLLVSQLQNMDKVEKLRHNFLQPQLLIVTDAKEVLANVMQCFNFKDNEHNPSNNY